MKFRFERVRWVMFFFASNAGFVSGLLRNAPYSTMSFQTAFNFTSVGKPPRVLTGWRRCVHVHSVFCYVAHGWMHTILFNASDRYIIVIILKKGDFKAVQNSWWNSGSQGHAPFYFWQYPANVVGSPLVIVGNCLDWEKTTNKKWTYWLRRSTNRISKLKGK